MNKQCTKCKEEKSEEAFGFRNKAKGIRRRECKACKCEYSRQHHEANREQRNETNRQYHEANKEQRNERRRQHHEANREHEKERSRQYREANKTDPCYRLKNNVRSSTCHSIKLSTGKPCPKGASSQKYLPYTMEELMCHLETLFQEGMTRDNYGSIWHLDHIIPRCMHPYDTTKHPNFLKSWALSNLQPLRPEDNHSKYSFHEGKVRYWAKEEE